MLTSQDLKNIGNLIELKLKTQLEANLKPVKSDIRDIKTDVNTLKTDVAGLKTDVNTLKTDTNNLQRDMTLVRKDVKRIKNVIEQDFGFHEKHNLHVIKNVQEIQKHLGMTTMPIDPPILNSF